MQFVSSLFLVFCWSTPLLRVSRDFVVGWCLVFKALKSCWISLARVLFPGVYFISMAQKTATSFTVESDSAPSVAQADVVSQNSSSKPELVDEVFSLFKGYPTSQLEEKGMQFE